MSWRAASTSPRYPAAADRGRLRLVGDRSGIPPAPVRPCTRGSRARVVTAQARGWRLRHRASPRGPAEAGRGEARRARFHPVPPALRKSPRTYARAAWLLARPASWARSLLVALGPITSCSGAPGTDSQPRAGRGASAPGAAATGGTPGRGARVPPPAAGSGAVLGPTPRARGTWVLSLSITVSHGSVMGQSWASHGPAATTGEDRQREVHGRDR